VSEAKVGKFDIPQSHLPLQDAARGKDGMGLLLERLTQPFDTPYRAVRASIESNSIWVTVILGNISLQLDCVLLSYRF
jgi:hypothetical protein